MQVTDEEIFDAWIAGRRKLPPCDACGQDELEVVHEDLIWCDACGRRLERVRRFRAECRCGELVYLEQDPDKVDIFYLKCPKCGNEALLQKEKAK